MPGSRFAAFRTEGGEEERAGRAGEMSVMGRETGVNVCG